MPNQKNAPYPDELVEKIEQTAKEVVDGKKYHRHMKIKHCYLAGESGDTVHCYVKVDKGLMDISEPVETDLGEACIESVYPRDGMVAVSVGFKRENITNWQSEQE